jgi:hypothetical protein
MLIVREYSAGVWLYAIQLAILIVCSLSVALIVWAFLRTTNSTSGSYVLTGLNSAPTFQPASSRHSHSRAERDEGATGSIFENAEIFRAEILTTSTEISEQDSRLGSSNKWQISATAAGWPQVVGLISAGLSSESTLSLEAIDVGSGLTATSGVHNKPLDAPSTIANSLTVSATWAEHKLVR